VEGKKMVCEIKNCIGCCWCVPVLCFFSLSFFFFSLPGHCFVGSNCISPFIHPSKKMYFSSAASLLAPFKFRTCSRPPLFGVLASDPNTLTSLARSRSPRKIIICRRYTNVFVAA
jgi:hypothetical protein